jgi:hypothetical protein
MRPMIWVAAFAGMSGLGVDVRVEKKAKAR